MSIGNNINPFTPRNIFRGVIGVAAIAASAQGATTSPSPSLVQTTSLAPAAPSSTTSLAPTTPSSTPTPSVTTTYPPAAPSSTTTLLPAPSSTTTSAGTTPSGTTTTSAGTTPSGTTTTSAGTTPSGTTTTSAPTTPSSAQQLPAIPGYLTNQAVTDQEVMVDSCKDDQKVFLQFRKSECGAAIDTAINNRDALKAKTMLQHISLCENPLPFHQPAAIDEYCRRITLHNDALRLLQTFNGFRQFVSPTGQCAYNDLAEIARRIIDDQNNDLSAQDKAIENHPLKQVVQTCFQPFKLANECQAPTDTTTSAATTPSGTPTTSAATTPSGTPTTTAQPYTPSPSTTTIAQAQPSSSDLQQVGSSDQSTKGSTDWYSSIEAIIGFSVGGGTIVLACLAKGIYSCRKKPAGDTTNDADPINAMEQGRGDAVDGAQKDDENTDDQKIDRIVAYMCSEEVFQAIRAANINDNYPDGCTTDEQKEEFEEAVRLRRVLVVNHNQIPGDSTPNEQTILEKALAAMVADQ